MSRSVAWTQNEPFISLHQLNIVEFDSWVCDVGRVVTVKEVMLLAVKFVSILQVVHIVLLTLLLLFRCLFCQRCCVTGSFLTMSAFPKRQFYFTSSLFNSSTSCEVTMFCCMLVNFVL